MKVSSQQSVQKMQYNLNLLDNFALEMALSCPNSQNQICVGFKSSAFTLRENRYPTNAHGMVLRYLGKTKVMLCPTMHFSRKSEASSWWTSSAACSSKTARTARPPSRMPSVGREETHNISNFISTLSSHGC